MDRRQEVGAMVRARRTELGLSVRRAALDAGVDRQTWQSVEDGTRATQDRVYPAIERVLQLVPGTLLGVPYGSQPTDSPSGAPPEAASKPSVESVAPASAADVERLLDLAIKLHGDPAEFEQIYRRVLRKHQAGDTDRDQADGTS
jgi:transcriptional regulator with XRE-family HTH domain